MHYRVDKSLFDTYTDITVTPKSGLEFIIDTKYKIVNSSKNHYGIGNQDAYQILAYKQIHKSKITEPAVVLLYPKSSDDLQIEFRINGSNSTFMAWTIDISLDLRKDMSVLVNNLKSLIEQAITQSQESTA